MGLVERIRKMTACICAAWLLFVPQAVLAQDDVDGDDRALTEYEISCMDCHGPDGHGDGPMAPRLSKRPADLTKIAKSNGGVFPEKRIMEMIDGRAAIARTGCARCRRGAHAIASRPILTTRLPTSTSGRVF